MKVTKPIVKELASGEEFIVKQMRAEANALLPKHFADVESILLIPEGECTLNMDGEEHLLKQGGAWMMPPQVNHQMLPKTEFKAAHRMPQTRKIEYNQEKKSELTLLR